METQRFIRRGLQGLLMAGLLALVGEQSYELEITDEDLAKIGVLIKSETDEPIQWAHWERDQPRVLRVNTGFSAEPFKSAGRSFGVKRTNKGWVVVFRSSWES